MRVGRRFEIIFSFGKCTCSLEPLTADNVEASRDKVSFIKLFIASTIQGESSPA